MKIKEKKKPLIPSRSTSSVVMKGERSTISGRKFMDYVF